MSASYCYYNRSPILDLKSCFYQNAPHLVVASGSEVFEVSMWNLVTNSTTVLLNLKSDTPITSPSFNPQPNMIKISRSSKLPTNFLSREN
mmetsp:Transcript_18423/g.2994  ORF Transcript_18423/g.2994 Transcript_18423/m.2994 type:complete len:90 (+) Transcript_18423:1627-1896(+)